MTAKGRTAKEKKRIKAERLARLEEYRAKNPDLDFCGTTDAAKILGNSAQSVRALLRKSALDCEKKGNGYLISLESLEDYITGKGKRERLSTAKQQRREQSKICFNAGKVFLSWHFEEIVENGLAGKHEKALFLNGIAVLVETITRDAAAGFVYPTYENRDTIVFCEDERDVPENCIYSCEIIAYFYTKRYFSRIGNAKKQFERYYTQQAGNTPTGAQTEDLRKTRSQQAVATKQII